MNPRSFPRYQTALVSLGVSVVVTGMIAVMERWGGFQAGELMIFDRLIQLQASPNLDPRLLIVTITEADIVKAQQWPLSDQALAEVLATLQRHQPRVIGLDLYRNLPHPPGTQALQTQFQAPNVITITKLEDGVTETVTPHPSIPSARVGFNDLVLDPDGVVRRHLLYAFEGGENFYSFALRIVQFYLGQRPWLLQATPHELRLGSRSLLPLESHVGGYADIDARGYQILVRHRAYPNARQIRFQEVLDGTFDPSWVRDRIVLLGSTAPSLKDGFFTPFSSQKKTDPETPGVLVQGMMVSHLLDILVRDPSPFRFLSPWGEVLWMGGWATLGGGLVSSLRHPSRLVGTHLLAVTGLFGLVWLSFQTSIWFPVLAPLAALLVTSGSVLAYRLYYSDFHDGMTGLPNRRWLLQRLERAIALQGTAVRGGFALLFLELDRFQVVNESLGFPIADALIVAVAHRLRQTLAGYPAAIARVGNHEFALLIEEIPTMAQATELTDRIQQALNQPFHLHQETVFTTASVGITLGKPGLRQILQPSTLLQQAHTAMYRARALGKSRYAVFAMGMQSDLLKQFQLETDLHHAIESKEFELCYQPIIHLLTGTIVGFEALVRWHSSRHGLIGPMKFIPIAEETGMIVPLGAWVLQEACRQRKAWERQFSDNTLFMSVNLSSYQLYYPNFVEFVADALEKSGLDGHCLKLEITESTAMQDVETTIDLLLRLKALNIKFGIDDFGTGYSSLSYLRRFPINTLKVDRSFVSQMEASEEDAIIVESIITLSHALGVDVIAEGIEVPSQREQLQKMDCDYGQGYLFSPPVNGVEATALLERDVIWQS